MMFLDIKHLLYRLGREMISLSTFIRIIKKILDLY